MQQESRSRQATGGHGRGPRAPGNPVPPPPSRRNLLLAACIAGWGILRFCGPEIADDAFITWQYARNLVEGAGFVYEPGQWILGTTAPLYALFCAAGMVLRVSPWTWSLLGDVAWMGIVLWRVRQVFEAASRGAWFPLAALLLLVSFPVTLPVAGMETGLYMALVFSSLSVLARGGPPRTALLWAAAAFLLRPDGALVFLLAAGHLAARCGSDWRAFLRAMALPAIPLVLFCAVLFLLYGSPVPQSLQAKSGTALYLPFAKTFLGGLHGFCADYYGAPGLLPLAGLVFLLAAGRHGAVRPVRDFLILYTAFFAVGKAPDFGWYLTPLLVILTASGAAAAAWLAGRLAAGRAGPARAGVPATRLPLAAWAVGIGLLLPQMSALLSLGVRGARQWGRVDTDPLGFRAAGEKIALESRGGDALIASHEVGALGYFSRCRIFDMEGLVTPHTGGNSRELARLGGPGGADWFVHRFPLGGGEIEHQRYYRLLQRAGFEERHRFHHGHSEFVTIAFRSGALPSDP